MFYTAEQKKTRCKNIYQVKKYKGEKDMHPVILAEVKGKDALINYIMRTGITVEWRIS